MRRSTMRSVLVAVALVGSVVGLLQPGTTAPAQAATSTGVGALTASAAAAVDAAATAAVDAATSTTVDPGTTADVAAQASVDVAAASVAPLATAADWRNFNAGNIISDANFYAGGSMNAAQVQSFIEGRNSTCTSGYTCLYQYWQATPSMAGNAYCQAIGGSGGMSAAQIIAAVGAACNISQRALLVLLEKEQGLVTSRAPAPWRYSSATGFACPDTAPCDSSFGGFFYQVYYAARQFNVYKTFPTSYNHRPAAWNSVLYHPNSACGSSRIYVANSATAGLYNYTPYQPNSAALANMYGTGDSCSAYGNRNFWRQWTDWFGDPTSGSSIVRAAETGNIYLLSGSRRHMFPSQDIIDQFATLGSIQTVSAASLNGYAEGPNVSRTVVGPDGASYYADAGRLLRFRSCSQAADFGLGCSGIALTAAQVGVMRGGDEWLNQVARTPDGVQWLVQGRERREILDLGLLPQYGIPALSSNVTGTSVSWMTIGAPVLGPGLYATAGGAWTRLITNAGNWVIPGSTDGMSFALAARDVTQQSLTLVPTSNGTMPVRVRNGSVTAMLTNEGWLLVDAAQAGGTSLFPQGGAAAMSSIPHVTSSTAPFFLRERNGSTTYLLSGGLLQPMATQADIDFVVRAYGVSSRVWIGAPGVLTSVPLVSQVATGQVVRTATDVTWYLIDGSQRYGVADSGILRSLGLPTTPTVLTPEVMAARGPVAGTLSTNLVTCGGTTYLASGGRRYALTSAAIAAWGRAPTSLSDAVCARSTVASGTYGTTFVDESGAVYRIRDGGRYLLQGASALAYRDGLPSVAADATVIRQLPLLGTITQAAGANAIVRTPNGTLAFFDGSALLPFASAEIAAAYGGWSPVPVDATFVGLHSTGSRIASVAAQCGSTVGIVAGGRFLTYASTAVRSAYGLSHATLPASVCSRLQTGSTVTQYASAGGQTWLIENGQRRQLLTQRAIDRLGAPLTGITPVDAVALGMLPVGTPIDR